MLALRYAGGAGDSRGESVEHPWAGLSEVALSTREMSAQCVHSTVVSGSCRGSSDQRRGSPIVRRGQRDTPRLQSITSAWEALLVRPELSAGVRAHVNKMVAMQIH